MQVTCALLHKDLRRERDASNRSFPSTHQTDKLAKNSSSFHNIPQQRKSSSTYKGSERTNEPTYPTFLTTHSLIHPHLPFPPSHSLIVYNFISQLFINLSCATCILPASHQSLREVRIGDVQKEPRKGCEGG